MCWVYYVMFGIANKNYVKRPDSGGCARTCFCSTTKYTPFMIYLQNQLICNRHCSTEYNKLLYVCGGERYCELLANFAILGTSIAGMRERGVKIC